jgi:hypothetical protein
VTAEAERLIAKVEANKPQPVWRHRLHGFSVEVVNRNLFGMVLVKMPGGNMIEMEKAQFKNNYKETVAAGRLPQLEQESNEINAQLQVCQKAICAIQEGLKSHANNPSPI